MSPSMEVKADYTIAPNISPKNKQIPNLPLGYCLIVKSAELNGKTRKTNIKTAQMRSKIALQAYAISTVSP
jgi:hypothetical protein